MTQWANRSTGQLASGPETQVPLFEIWPICQFADLPVSHP
jgi:hypothetical protein